ncbi:MAG: hypothetical protein R3F37_07675 [Candidatus Competibacteraceae bacterium]
MQQNFVLAVALPGTLFCIMFGMGAKLTPQDSVACGTPPGAIAAGIISQMVLLPALALLTVSLFHLPPEIVVGLMILAFSPGGTVSNLFAYLAHGNVAYPSH